MRKCRIIRWCFRRWTSAAPLIGGEGHQHVHDALGGSWDGTDLARFGVFNQSLRNVELTVFVSAGPRGSGRRRTER
jgi:hypothetical protein